MLIIVMIGLYDWFLWVVWNNCTIAKNFQPLSFLHKKRDWMEWIRLLLLLPYFLLLDHRILMFGGGGGAFMVIWLKNWMVSIFCIITTPNSFDKF